MWSDSHIRLDRYRGRSGDFVRVWGRSCGFEPDGSDEVVEDALVEAVELRSALAVELGLGADRREKTGGERGLGAIRFI